MIDLQSLSALLDDEQLVQKYLRRFADDMPALLVEMRNAFETGDYQALGMHAHTLKSQFQYVNAIEAGSTAIQLEKVCTAAVVDTQSMLDHVNALDQYIRVIVTEINAING